MVLHLFSSLDFGTESRKLRPEMERIGFELNALLLKDFNSDELSSAIESVRKIALNAAKL